MFFYRILYISILFIAALINSSFINLKNEPVGTIPTKKVEAVTITSDIDNIRSSIRDYIWPTDASQRITSSFAEYRTNHFHGGIDISTNGQTGYKVFAVEDGYVLKIRITPNGYGKMIFVKHKDGFVSTYAHLLSFNDAIIKVTRREQYRKETYAVDLTLDSLQLPVKKGEVIAFTGESGFGPPHLHFELRDQNLNPINPLLNGNYNFTDHIPPLIRRVMVEPLSYNSTIENNNTPRYFSRFPRNKHGLFIPQAIKAHGLIGFGVDAVDRADGVWGRTGIHGMDFYLDDSLIFAMELNKVPIEETKQIDLHYDLESILYGRGKFQKLFIDEGNSLPFYYSKTKSNGIINTDALSEGKHNYRIVCTDIQGNAAELAGTIIANHKPEIKIASYNDEEITLTGNNLKSIEKCLVFGKRSFQTVWSQHTLINGRFELTGNVLHLPINTKPYDVVKVIVETKFGSLSWPIFHFIKKPLGSIHSVYVKKEILKDNILLTLTTPGVFTETPQIILREGASTQALIPSAMDIDKYQIAFTPSDSYHGNRVIEVHAEVNGKVTTSSSEIVIYPITSDKSGSFTTTEGKLKISYDSAAVYRSLFLQVETENDKRIASYKLEPTDELLHGGIFVSVPIPSDANKQNLGLYYRLNGGWIFQTGQVDNESNTFTTLLNHKLGELSLIHDDAQPSFGYVKVRTGSGNVNISFRYHDNLSGVDTDEIKMYIDDKFVIPEIDGEHSRVLYHSTEPLDRGKHHLTIKMKDRAKNEAELTRNFIVR